MPGKAQPGNGLGWLGTPITALPAMSDANSQTQSLLPDGARSALHFLRDLNYRRFLFRMSFKFADILVRPGNPFSFSSHFIHQI